MKLEEIFDSQYTLKLADTAIKDMINPALRQDGFTSTMIYQVANDTTQIFMMGFKSGAWEVHHALAEPGKPFVSRNIINGSRSANPKFISTAMHLYQTRLDKGHTVRIVGNSAMWPTYKRVIDRMLKTNKYVASEVTVNSNSEHSQTLATKGKLESLTSMLVPL